MAELKPQELRQTLHRFLSTIDALSLATVDDHGAPYAANLYFAPDERLNLYFVSHPKSAHSRHLAARPRVGATVYEPAVMWQRIRGVQLTGRCRPVPDEQWDAVRAVYGVKFPYVAEVEDLIRAQQFYRIEPDWCRWIDNCVRFGYKVESPWPPPDR